ncbi:hypothetical protein [Roseomonas sp. USHLN139]|uniref:hypothetical protein n=1 Tax=Roseomonas sp. USHLN139 TaxID=3081298 RepID=UPI003B02858D
MSGGSPLSRRLLLALPLLAPLAPARAAGPLQLRLRPGAPPLLVRSHPEEAPERLVRLRLSGPGAPSEVIVLPTRYGGDTRLTRLPLGWRDILLAEMDGEGGTGVSQRLGVLIALDAAGRLRVIGIENLEIQEAATCESEARLRGRLSAGPAGLRLAGAFRRLRLSLARAAAAGGLDRDPKLGRPGRRAGRRAAARGGAGAARHGRGAPPRGRAAGGAGHRSARGAAGTDRPLRAGLAAAGAGTAVTRP